MGEFVVTVGGKEYDVTAPDERTAWRWANATLAKGSSAGKATDPTEGNSFLQNAAIGAGKAVADTGRGIRQLASYVGIGDKEAIQREIDEAKQRDAPLMGTGGGIVGNVAGHLSTALIPGAALAKAPGIAGAVGRSVMSNPATLRGAAQSGAAWGGISAAQPVATGDNRMVNALIGGGAGAAPSIVGMGLKGMGAAAEPLYQGGRDAIVGRAMRSAAGPGADDAMRAMQGAQELVPGSQPTTAQVANSGGIAALERSARAIDPEAYAARDLQQNAARADALRNIAGDADQMAQFEGVRGLMSDLPYAQAKAQKVPITVSDRAVSDLMERPSLQTAWQQAETMAREAGVTTVTSKGELTGEALHFLKMALDDQIAGAQRAGQGTQARLLMDTRDKLRAFTEKAIPQYKVARENFAEWSKPINQMEIGQHLLEKLQPALSDFGQNATQRGASYAQAVRNAPGTIRSATGTRFQSLDDIMSPSQMNVIQNVGADLSRKAMAENLGRGAGSDTVQKLAMNNILERSGMPAAVGNLPFVSRVSRAAYAAPEELMKQRLAQALLNPHEAAALMQKATPRERRMVQALMASSPPLLGSGAVAALNAQ